MKNKLLIAFLEHENVHITYRSHYRKCRKPTCQTCIEGKGHGPYLYGHYRQDGKRKSFYVGNPEGYPWLEVG
jgi:hypothetical protein